MPEELARKVRIKAAEADTSVSKFLCKLAAKKVADKARNHSGINLNGQKLPTREELHDRDAFR